MEKFNWKSLTKEQLEWAYESFSFPEDRRPRWHQLVSLAFAAEKKRVGFWHGVGTGKTLVSYWTARQWGCKKILVICPLSAISSWVRDAKVENLSYEFIFGETEERRKLINGNQDVSIIRYDHMKPVWCDFVLKTNTKMVADNLSEKAVENYLEVNKDCKVAKSKKHFGRYSIFQKQEFRKWEVNRDLFNQNFDCIIFDEIHKCSNYESLQTDICLNLSKKVSNCIALTGTPIDKSLYELFNIHQVFDLGTTFGWNCHSFKRNNFRKEGYDWVVTKAGKEYILNQWSKSSISFDKSECFDLPPCEHLILEVPRTQEFQKYENKVINNIPIQKKVFSLSSVKAIKLKQLTDGFMYYEDDFGVRQVIQLKENPKLEATTELFDYGHKVIVFYQYEEVGKMLSESLSKKGIRFVHFCSGLNPHERLDLEHRFQNDPSVLGAVAQIDSSAEGWDGFAATILVFYDVIASSRKIKQCIGRMERGGQVNKSLVLELIMKDTINEVTKENQIKQKSEVEEYMKYIQNRK